jgi:Tfp pilus assembly protein PilX
MNAKRRGTEAMVNKYRSKSQSGDSGVALILVLLALLVLTTLAAAMVFNARTDTLASYNYRVGMQAEYVALAGVQRALNFFNSSRYAPVPPASATTYYNVSIYATNPVNMYFANAAPVTCLASCSSTGNVALIPTSGSSVYPPSAGTAGVDVAANWLAEMNNTAISDGLGGAGNYSVKASLMEYHTVNNAFYGVPATGCSDASAGMGICRQPFEVWKITSTGTWNSNIGGGSASPTVQVVATISPMFLPYFGNALYGLCNVTLSGNVCTDSYSSGKGQYGASAASCVTLGTSTTNAQLTGAGVGSNGGVTVSGNANTVGGNVTYANQNSTASCNTGFQGTAAGVVGSVLPGPAVPPPPNINMSVWGYPTATPAVTPASGGGSVIKIANVYTKQTTPPPLPPGATNASGGAATACPAGATGYLETFTASSSTSKGTTTNTYDKYSCIALSGSGTATDPYRLGDVAAGSGSGGNTGTINIIGPSGAMSSPIFIAANNITVGNNGVINTSYQAPSEPGSGPDTSTPSFSDTPPAPTSSTATPFVIDVKGSVNMGGQSNMNYNSSTPGIPSPSYLTMNIMGTGTALSLSGQSQLGAVINIPNGDASLGGSGSSGTLFGSILANNINDHGNYPLHYDLSMRTISGQMFTAQVVSVTRPKL